MNEYTIYYLNGIIAYLEATEWKDAIIEAKMNAQRKEFLPNIKYIMDGEGGIIKDIDVEKLTFNQKLQECVSFQKNLVH